MKSWQQNRFAINARQTIALSIAMIKSRYRKTLAGFIWVVTSPILMYSIQSIVFKKFLEIDVPDYYLFLLGGLLPWIFITSTLEMCTPLLTSQSDLLKNFQVPPLNLISAQVLDNFINFIFSFFILLIPVTFFFEEVSYGVLLLPLTILQLLIGVISLAILLSTLQVFFRDIRFLLPFTTNILFFMTPIFYPPWVVPENFRWVVDFNPFYKMIEPFRACIYHFDPNYFWPAFGEGFLASFIFAVTAFFFWRMKSHAFYLKL